MRQLHEHVYRRSKNVTPYKNKIKKTQLRALSNCIEYTSVFSCLLNESVDVAVCEGGDYR